VGGQQITKLRYVEASHFHKLFQVYMPSLRSNGKLPDLAKYDAVVVIDYGHGMADKEFIDAVGRSRFLAVNVQTNSGNYGYNLCTKYPQVAYLCIDEAEARLATQNRSGPIEDSLHALGKNAKKVVITLGKQGAIGCDDDVVTRASAYTSQVVDTMGAGDAFFAITALVAEEADMPDLLRIGNAAGAIKSQIVGHQRSVSRGELIQYLDTVRPEGDAGHP
jgi:sugar/nucleoside kinase (ribokinase family)